MLSNKVFLWTVLRIMITFNVALAMASQFRVINGWSDDAGDYPYIVRLESNSTLVKDHDFHVICSGTLLTNQWVLTAVHCLVPILTFVRYGNMAVPRKDANISRILKKIAHPNGKVINDIALLLIEKIHMKTTGKLCSDDFKTLVGRTVVIAGYGATATNLTLLERLKSENRSLQVGEGFIFKTMDDITKPVLVVAPKCATPIHGVYHGDSGGPLLDSGKVVAVATAVFKVHARKLHVRNIQFFTPVSPYLNWIEDIIHKEK